MLSISATLAWRDAHPGAAIGLLELSGIDNSQPAPALEQRKREIEAGLRQRCQGFTRADFLALPLMSTYQGYYRRFDKTYHVLLQVESLVLKSKNLPAVSPLVDACFAAEVDTLVLTAGHDAAKLHPPICIDVARPGDGFIQMGGALRSIPAGDMVMKDANGITCSILYGQDNLSPISPSTSHVLYVAYAPAGIPGAAVEAHLRAIETLVRLFAPAAVLEQRTLLT